MNTSAPFTDLHTHNIPPSHILPNNTPHNLNPAHIRIRLLSQLLSKEIRHNHHITDQLTPLHPLQILQKRIIPRPPILNRHTSIHQQKAARRKQFHAFLDDAQRQFKALLCPAGTVRWVVCVRRGDVRRITDDEIDVCARGDGGEEV